MNGWLLVRIAGIVVGIATLLRVATTQGLVTYDPLFLAWMDWLSDIVELGFLTKLIGPFLHWGIDYVRGLGITVPDLQDEWRPAFVLSTLMFGALARHNRGGWLLAIAPVGALVVAVWAGLIGHLEPVAVVAYAAGAIAAAGAAVAVAVAARARVAAARTTAARVVVIFVAFYAVLAAAILAIAIVVVAIFASGVAVAVAAVAGAFLFAGFVESWGSGWQAQFANSNFNIGIDILFTMSVAFVIAVAVANPPIW